MPFMACYLKQASFRNTDSHFLSYTLRYGCFVYFSTILQQNSRLWVSIQNTGLHIYVQVVLPNPYPVGGLGMNMQYTIKTEDIQNKGEGKGQVDNTASELMAISTQTSTKFALPEARGFESVSPWLENILLIQDSGSMFQCVSIPSSFPSQEILVVWKQAEGDSYLPEWQ